MWGVANQVCNLFFMHTDFEFVGVELLDGDALATCAVFTVF